MKINLKFINLLDNNGYYKLADYYQNQMIKIAAFPYNLSALDELPLPARQVTWERNKEDFQQYDDVFWQELKARLPDYRNLNIDKSEEKNYEGELHGPDPIPGPAFVWPTGNSQLPSMTGDLNNFTWDVSHDLNEGPEYWKNLLPRY